MNLDLLPQAAEFSAGNETGRDYRFLLREEFSHRKGRNRRYSVRAFAKFLGVSKTSLADTLALRRHLSKKSAFKVCDRLCFSPALIQDVLKAIARERNSQNHSASFHAIDDDVFSLISDWFHYAILSLGTQGK